MPVRRERTDPIRTPDSLGEAHRRWILPDDVARPIGLSSVARLWRGLLDLEVLEGRGEVRLERLGSGGQPESVEMPAPASPGALLAASGAVTRVTQIVWLEEDRRDPYQEDSREGYRDYTLYAVDSPRHLLLPIPPIAHLCGACGTRQSLDAPRFGEAELLDLDRACARCGATLDLGRDKAELNTGAVFLLEELACRAALSIELPIAPEAEELPDPAVAQLLLETFGGIDELADDHVAPAE